MCVPDADPGQPSPCPTPQHSLSAVYLALLGPEGVSGPGREAQCNPQARGFQVGPVRLGRATASRPQGLHSRCSANNPSRTHQCEQAPWQIQLWAPPHPSDSGTLPSEILSTQPELQQKTISGPHVFPSV